MKNLTKHILTAALGGCVGAALVASVLLVNLEAKPAARYDVLGNDLELLNRPVIMYDERVVTVEQLLFVYDELYH